MSTIITKPIKSSSSGGTTSTPPRKLFVVGSSQYQVVDSVRIVEYVAAKWMVSIKNLTDNTTMMMDVSATHNDIQPYYSQSNILGQPMLLHIQVLIMGGTHMVLQITNNTTSSVEIRVQSTLLAV